MHLSFNTKMLLFAGRLLERFWKKYTSVGLQEIQRLAARLIWRSGTQNTSYGRFRSNDGTHMVLLEQMTSGENLDCAITFRRPKLARNDI